MARLRAAWRGSERVNLLLVLMVFAIMVLMHLQYLHHRGVPL
jgi:hypothetical protein